MDLCVHMGMRAQIIQTFVAGAVLVLAGLCYYEIRELRSEVNVQGEQSITTDQSSESVTTGRAQGESVADWLERHRAALAAL